MDIIFWYVLHKNGTEAETKRVDISSWNLYQYNGLVLMMPFRIYFIDDARSRKV